MTPTVCSRHPASATHVGYCAACLIEEALATPGENDTPEIAGCTIKVPLGDSPRASVFVVESQAGLRRLKRWRLKAPPGFLEAFHDLRRRLHASRPASILLPLDASVDADGHPAVLSEFRQGMPLFECVSAGRLTSAEASSLLQQLGESLKSAHARGLVHGSVVPGNIIVTRERASCLLDFGIATLLAPAVPFEEWVRRDLNDYLQRATELHDLARR